MDQKINSAVLTVGKNNPNGLSFEDLQPVVVFMQSGQCYEVFLQTVFTLKTFFKILLYHPFHGITFDSNPNLIF